jgi:hypothetical protein
MRANDVHDSSVRRIDTITPDMIAPRSHEMTARKDRTNFRPVRIACRTVLESKDNIAKRTRRVRVQTVNASLVVQKARRCPRFLDESGFLTAGRAEPAAAAIGRGK